MINCFSMIQCFSLSIFITWICSLHQDTFVYHFFCVQFLFNFSVLSFDVHWRLSGFLILSHNLTINLLVSSTPSFSLFSSLFSRSVFSWYVTLPSSLLFYINICIKQILYLVIFLAPLCHSIFLIFSLILFLSLLCVFCCSSTICHSTHSLYVTVTLSLYLPLLLYNLFVAPMLFSCANTFSLPHFASLSLAPSHSHFLFITVTLSVSSFPPFLSHTIPLLFSTQVRSFTGCPISDVFGEDN